MKYTIILAVIATALRATTVATFEKAQFGSGRIVDNGIVVSGSGVVLEGASTYFGPAINTGHSVSVHGNDWTSISTGSSLDSISLRYGFDWNGSAIDYGLMDVTVEWQALKNGKVVDVGGYFFGRSNPTHGGDYLLADTASPFDTLLIRSTAVEYAGIYGSNDGWLFSRGAVIGWGAANHIAIDDVVVTEAGGSGRIQSLFAETVASVPDSGSAGMMLGAAMVVCGIWHVRRI